MPLMAKRANKPESSSYPSREKVKYVGISLDLHEKLVQVSEEEDRSLAWLARKAITEFLERRARTKQSGSS